MENIQLEKKELTKLFGGKGGFDNKFLKLSFYPEQEELSKYIGEDVKIYLEKSLSGFMKNYGDYYRNKLVFENWKKDLKIFLNNLEYFLDPKYNLSKVIIELFKETFQELESMKFGSVFNNKKENGSNPVIDVVRADTSGKKQIFFLHEIFNVIYQMTDSHNVLFENFISYAYAMLPICVMKRVQEKYKNILDSLENDIVSNNISLDDESEENVSNEDTSKDSYTMLFGGQSVDAFEESMKKFIDTKYPATGGIKFTVNLGNRNTVNVGSPLPPSNTGVIIGTPGNRQQVTVPNSSVMTGGVNTGTPIPAKQGLPVTK